MLAGHGGEVAEDQGQRPAPEATSGLEDQLDSAISTRSQPDQEQTEPSPEGSSASPKPSELQSEESSLASQLAADQPGCHTGEIVQPDADAKAALEGLRSQAAMVVAGMPNGSSDTDTDTDTQVEVRTLLAKLTANGTSLLLSADCEHDYETCTAYFKLALQVDPGNLHVAKLLELSLALLVDPGDLESKREVAQLRVELSSKARPVNQLAASAQTERDAGSEPQQSGLYAPGLQIVSPGVRKQVLRAGDNSTFPERGDLLTMHYTGSLAASGKVFDSSVKRGDPFRFQIGIGQVIQGWDEGVVRMSLGEKAILHIGSDYAYGSEAVGDGAIPANSDLIFEVELLAIGNQTFGDDGGSEDIGASVTDLLMGGLFGGAWQYMTGQDLLPDGEEDLSETLPHTWSLSGCPDARYSGTYAPDTDAPEANLQAHYCNQGGMHLYHKDGWWVLKDIFTPDENSSIARLLSSSNGLLQPGQHTWEWWNDGDWSSIELEMQQNFTPLVVSGTPDGRFSGLYRHDTTHPTANGQPHFSNESRAHLFFGTAKGWCECANCYFASKPHV